MSTANAATRDYVVVKPQIWQWPKADPDKKTAGRAPAMLKLGAVLKLTADQAHNLVGKVKLKKVVDAEQTVSDVEGEAAKGEAAKV